MTERFRERGILFLERVIFFTGRLLWPTPLICMKDWESAQFLSEERQFRSTVIISWGRIAAGRDRREGLSGGTRHQGARALLRLPGGEGGAAKGSRSEEHTSELQSLRH